MRNGNDHILTLDEVLIVHIRAALSDFTASRCGKFFTNIRQFILDDFHDAFTRPQNIEIFLDVRADRIEFIGNLVSAQSCQSRQAKLENGTRLLFRQIVCAVFIDPMTRVINQQDQRRDISCRPAALHQLGTRRARIRRLADQRDDFINIGNGNGKTNQNMGPFAHLVQQEFCTATDHLLAESDEGFQHVQKDHLLRLAAIERHHVATE